MAEKILICDDEAAMRQMTARALKPKGYELLQAEDGTEALDCVKQQKPNLLLLDMRLPDMDGLDVLGEAKKIYPEMEVIMISGFGDVEHALEALKLGAFDYISKPYKIEVLHNRVAEALAKYAAAHNSKPAPAPAPTPEQTTVVSLEKPPLCHSEAILCHSEHIRQAQCKLREESRRSPPSTTGDSSVAMLPQNDKKAAFAEDEKKSLSPPPTIKKKRIWPIISIIALTLIIAAGTWYFHLAFGIPTAGDFKTVSYNVPYANPSAMAYGESCLWVADWMTQSIYRHNLDDKLTVAKVYYIKDSHITGLAWDGTNLWSCDSWAGKLYKHNFDDDLSLIAEFPVLGATPGGLFWDGMHMWVCDTKGGSFYKLKITPAGVEMIDAYNAPGPKPVGLFVDGDFAYSADAKTNKIYKHKASDMSVTGIFAVPEYEENNNVIAGMTWDGNYIWTCAEGAKKVLKHSPKSMRVAR